MRRDAPAIAIVGRACLLPGASGPEQLWDAVCAGRDLLSGAPAGRWGLAPEDVLCSPDAPSADRTWSDRGGYVTGFDEIFDATGFRLSAGQVGELDPVYRWLMHTAREAVRDAGVTGGERVGAIFGNLGYPSASLIALANAHWIERLEGPQEVDRLGLRRPAAVNRFVAGRPAALLCDALGLEAGAFALDAACASSLYAVKLAADRLADGDADVMLAGAICCADSLLIHQGFAALGALSRSGRSRPFDRAADGLVPAEGCAFVVLKPLAAAIRDGNRIDGVIRGIGLSNDGSSEGLLVPSCAGQERAMRAAYAAAGIPATSISLLECHATGTPVGDAVELASIAAVFGPGAGLPIGSLKSNLGHLITAAGAAGLIKVLEAMRHGIRPPMRAVHEASDAVAESGARILTQAEAWEVEGPRLAAVSAFGFGGNNAHLVLEGYEPGRPAMSVAAAPVTDPDIVIVGIGIRSGELTDRASFVDGLLADAPCQPGSSGEIELALAGLRFPPRDLDSALGQQTLALASAIEAVADAGELPWERTGVFVGIETDPDAARYGLRWHLASWARRWGMDGDWLARARDGVTAPFDNASTLGAMPNMPANRLNRQFGAQGPSFTVSAGERSGLDALDIAARALRRGELDAALVGAVDLSVHELHEDAAAQVLPRGALPAGDAAVTLVLKRRVDAEASGDRLYAVLDDSEGDDSLTLGAGDAIIAARFGHAHAADGLLRLASGALCLHHRALPSGDPWLARGRRTVTVEADNGGLGGGRWRLAGESGARRESDRPGPRFHFFKGIDVAEVLARLETGAEGGEGPACLVVVASSPAELAERMDRARGHLASGHPPGVGVHFRAQPLSGEVAFVYAAAGAAYRGMGRGLLRALPELGDELTARAPHFPDVMRWVYGDGRAAPQASEFLWSTSALSQLHTSYTRELLALQPNAMLGYSSGETNTLFAGGAWTDIESMYREIEASGLMERELGGSFEALARRWGAPAQWRMWGVRAPLGEVSAIVAGEERAHIAIVNTASDCIIAGEEAAVGRVAIALGSERCRELAYRFVCHVPEVAEVAELWQRIHSRPVTPTPGIRYYTNAYNAAYEPGVEACATALLAQAVAPIDFRATVERAYADGVRVFVEHGPAAGCSRWIGEILADRPHLAVPLDRRDLGIDATLDATAALAAAGVQVDLGAVSGRLSPRRQPAAAGPTLRLPARWPAVALPSREEIDETAPRVGCEPARAAAPQAMPPAPALTPVLGHDSRAPVTALRLAARANGTTVPQRAAVVSPAAGGSTSAEALTRLFQEHSTVHERAILRLAAAHRQFLAAASAGVPARAPDGGLPAQLAAVGPHGPSFDRAALELHASGRISAIFGPQFEAQDGYLRQVRMPQPPLLLADRVTGLAAESASMGTGTIWTETDVRAGAWYLHDGRMPAGVTIETGQADLMLISYLGVDLLNRGERVYRLLGCTVTFKADLPSPGDTLAHQITVDRHLDHDGTRVFFFHYDCSVGGRVSLSVRDGHAGFFTDAELANSGGVVWSAELVEPSPDPRLQRAAVATQRRSFSARQVRAFAAGDAYACFGSGFEAARAHVRSPCVADGEQLFIDEVTELDHAGGPWGRGYMRAETAVAPHDWYFEGHFLNDPCMPGTLMFEATLQCMAFYLAASGFTLERDGYRFRPVLDEPFVLKCRGQVTPDSRHLLYEIFVQELLAGPTPTLYADVLVTADGRKAFHGERIGLALVPDWPLTSRPELLVETGERPPAARADGIEFGYPALLAAAWGRPSDAFGPQYARFDGERRVARLPGPPYHFMSRVTRVDGELGAYAAGLEVECEYDIPADAWYFGENGAPTMPSAVLMEAALQPCGWLACYAGCPLSVDTDLAFRNLDGVGTVHAEVTPAAARLRTVARLKGLSANAGTIITSFEVTCRVGEQLVYELDTVFGFFPLAALQEQVGLPTTTLQLQQLADPGGAPVALRERPAHCFPERGPALAGPMLLMLDRISGFWPTGGAARLGAARAETDVDAGAWYFKSHFFQDPVQPGSLGVEALLQLLQWLMLETGMTAALPEAHFEPIALGRPLRWRYRGQVTPANDLIVTTIEITDTGLAEGLPFAICDGSLWVDGKRIYEVSGLAMQVVR